jgi:hypothetical protein
MIYWRTLLPRYCARYPDNTTCAAGNQHQTHHGTETDSGMLPQAEQQGLIIQCQPGCKVSCCARLVLSAREACMLSYSCCPVAAAGLLDSISL